MSKEVDSEEAITRAVCMFVSILIMVGVIGGFFLWVNSPSDRAHNICQHYGHEKATDTSIGNCIDYPTVRIECDNEKIIEVETERVCDELNKWGDCDWYYNNYTTTIANMPCRK